MNRAVDVLPKQDKLTVNVSSIHDRTRGVARAVNGFHGPGTDGKSRFLALQSDVDGKRLDSAAIPGGSCDTVVARFQIYCVQLMSYDSAAICVSYGPGSSGMIEVAVSEEQILELGIRCQAFGNVFYELRVTSTSSRINKGCFIAEADKVHGRVRRISQLHPADVPEIVPDSDAQSDSLFVRCTYIVRPAASHSEYYNDCSPFLAIARNVTSVRHLHKGVLYTTWCVTNTGMVAETGLYKTE